MKYVLLMTTALLSFTAQPACADPEIDALKNEVKLLQERISQLEKKRGGNDASTLSNLAPAAGTPDKPNVEQRLAIVERNQELAQDAAKDKRATEPKISIGAGKGFTIASPDKQYSINIRAYAQADDRTFFNGAGSGATDSFLIRTARPIFEAKMTDYFNARMMWDFGQGNSRLLDAYFDFHPLPSNDIVNLRVGQMKVPVGIERWQSEQEILLTERGQTTNLVPFRDIGAMVNGTIPIGQLEYHLGIVNGASDLQINNGDADNNKDVVGRIFAHPLEWSGVHAFEGIGVGVAGTYGQHAGSTAAGASGLTTGYVSPGQRTYFTYTPAAGTVFADGANWRLNPQATYYNGPFSTIGEYVMESQNLTKGASSENLKNQAWMVMATYVLTGEDASFNGVKPAHEFNPSAGNWGAFELVGRYSQLNIDPKTFPTFANLSTSAKKAQETSIGGTWYFNPMVKLNLDYSLTKFDGGNAGGTDRADEKVLVTRTQFRF